MNKIEWIAFISVGVAVGKLIYTIGDIIVSIIAQYIHAIRSKCSECGRGPGFHSIKCSKLKF